MTLTGVSQLWWSGLSAVDDAEEFVVQGLVMGPMLAVADQDAIDRAEMGDLGGGAGEEGLVADVEHLAWQRLLDDLDAELAASVKTELRVMPLSTELARGEV